MRGYGFKGYWQNKLVSADFAGYTIRKRLFLQFSKEKSLLGTPIKSHDKYGKGYPEWKAVKEVLNLESHGASIFTRKKDFVPKTHRKIV